MSQTYWWNEELDRELKKAFENHPEAGNFLQRYGALCHGVDDIIDRDNGTISDYRLHTLDCFNLALDLFSCRFYQANVSWLYPLAKQTHRLFSTSILWENSDVEWKKKYADVMRCFGNEMANAVLEHVCHLPYSELRRLDAMMREYSWKVQHDESGNPK